MTWVVCGLMAAVALASLPLRDEARLFALARISRAQQNRLDTSIDIAPSRPSAQGPKDTAADLGTIERAKFDRVYAAAVAAREALLSAPRSLVAQQAFLAFNAEAAMAVDRAQTKAERQLAARYTMATLWVEHARVMTRTAITVADYKKGLAEALDGIEAANKIYLGIR